MAGAAQTLVYKVYGMEAHPDDDFIAVRAPKHTHTQSTSVRL